MVVVVAVVGVLSSRAGSSTKKKGQAYATTMEPRRGILQVFTGNMGYGIAYIHSMVLVLVFSFLFFFGFLGGGHHGNEQTTVR